MKSYDICEMFRVYVLRSMYDNNGQLKCHKNPYFVYAAESSKNNAGPIVINISQMLRDWLGMYLIITKLTMV